MPHIQSSIHIHIFLLRRLCCLLLVACLALHHLSPFLSPSISITAIPSFFPRPPLPSCSCSCIFLDIPARAHFHSSLPARNTPSACTPAGYAKSQVSIPSPPKTRASDVPTAPPLPPVHHRSPLTARAVVSQSPNSSALDRSSVQSLLHAASRQQLSPIHLQRGPRERGSLSLTCFV